MFINAPMSCLYTYIDKIKLEILEAQNIVIMIYYLFKFIIVDINMSNLDDIFSIEET